MVQGEELRRQVAQLPSDAFCRLSKIVGCLVDVLLVLNGGTYIGAEAQISSPIS